MAKQNTEGKFCATCGKPITRRINCSIKCRNKYMRKNKISVFYNPSLRKKMLNKCKKEKRGLWKKGVRSKAGKLGHIQSAITQKKKQVGFYNSDSQAKNGQKGCASIRKNKNAIITKSNVLFSSKGEAQIGLCIEAQYCKLIEGKTFQVPVGRKLFDFYIPQLNCFIEYHPIVKFYSKLTTRKEYYKSRRKSLNLNGYKTSALVVIP